MTEVWLRSFHGVVKDNLPHFHWQQYQQTCVACDVTYNLVRIAEKKANKLPLETEVVALDNSMIFTLKDDDQTSLHLYYSVSN